DVNAKMVITLDMIQFGLWATGCQHHLELDAAVERLSSVLEGVQRRMEREKERKKMEVVEMEKGKGKEKVEVNGNGKEDATDNEEEIEEICMDNGNDDDDDDEYYYDEEVDDDSDYYHHDDSGYYGLFGFPGMPFMMHDDDTYDEEEEMEEDGDEVMLDDEDDDNEEHVRSAPKHHKFTASKPWTKRGFKKPKEASKKDKPRAQKVDGGGVKKKKRSDVASPVNGAAKKPRVNKSTGSAKSRQDSFGDRGERREKVRKGDYDDLKDILKESRSKTGRAGGKNAHRAERPVAHGYGRRGGNQKLKNKSGGRSSYRKSSLF
ncbi:hypothetical protein HDU76_004949, partial [Blyttiomyces sp. JEL0837]